MKKLLLSSAILFGMTLTADASCQVIGVASYDTLNVRFLPSYKSKKVGELSPNARGINIIYCKRKAYSSPWCKISYYAGSAKIIGWVNSKYLYCPSVNYYCVDGVSRYDTLAVRSYPNYQSSKVGELSPYAIGVKKIKCVGNWCKVSYKAGGARIIGWVNSKYLVPCER
jgi:uncharacterized protein YraI